MRSRHDAAATSYPTVGRSPAEVRKVSFLLASETGLDPRTCRKAVERGSDALLSVGARVLVTEAARRLGIELP